MYDSVFNDMMEPVRNLEDYHNSQDGPWLPIGETTISGQFSPAAGRWGLAAAYNYDGFNKLMIEVSTCFDVLRCCLNSSAHPLDACHSRRVTQHIVVVYVPKAVCHIHCGVVGV
jgi:hypothetical protein